MYFYAYAITVCSYMIKIIIYHIILYRNFLGNNRGIPFPRLKNKNNASPLDIKIKHAKEGAGVFNKKNLSFMYPKF